MIVRYTGIFGNRYYGCRMQGGRHRMIVRYTGIFGNRYYGCRMQGGR